MISRYSWYTRVQKWGNSTRHWKHYSWYYLDNITQSTHKCCVYLLSSFNVNYSITISASILEHRKYRMQEISKALPFSHRPSLVSRSAAKPMLSLVITLFNMSWDPSAVDIASLLNSIRCSFISENLQNNALINMVNYALEP